MHGGKGVVNIVLAVGMLILIALIFMMGNVLATPLLKLTPETKAADIGLFVETIYAAPEDIALKLKIKEPTIVREGEVPALLISLYAKIKSGEVELSTNRVFAELIYEVGGSVLTVPTPTLDITNDAGWNIVDSGDASFSTQTFTDDFTIHKQIDRTSTNSNYQITFP